jgi:hypothetical protein
MVRLGSISILVIALFAALEFQPRAQTPPPAAAQKTDKPALNADKLAIDWVDRMNGLSSWYLSVDGKEDDAEKVVDHMMELFTPDIIAEVPPHDERQEGPVQLVGTAQVRKWVEKLAKSQVEIRYVIKRQTMKEFEGEYMIFSRPLPWGGMGVAMQLLEADSQRADRKRFMQAGGAFLQFNNDGKIYRMRLVLSEKEEIVDLGVG